MGPDCLFWRQLFKRISFLDQRIPPLKYCPSCTRLYSDCWDMSLTLHLKSLTTIITPLKWKGPKEKIYIQIVSFSSSATGLWEKAGSKAKSIVTLSSCSPTSHYPGTASWRAVEELFRGSREGTCKASQQIFRKVLLAFFYFFFFLTFPKLLHPQTRLTFWLSAKEFVPWSGRQRIAHENGQLELTANNSDNNLATDFSRQGSRNGTVAFGTVQTQLLLFGGVPEMWGTYIWVGTTALWFTTSNLSTVGGFYSHSPSYSCSLKHLSASVQNTQQSCGQQQPPGISPFSYLCDRQAATLRQHHCFFYS